MFLGFPFPRWDVDSGIKTVPLTELHAPKILRYAAYLVQLLRVVIRSRGSCLIAVNEPGAVVGAWVAVLLRIPVAVLAQEHNYMDGISVKSRILAWHFRRASVVYDISTEASQWRRCVMKLRGSCGTFRNLPPLRHNGEVLRATDFQNRPLSLVFTGHIADSMCLKECINAIGRVTRPVVLNLYGFGNDGYLREALAEARRLGVGSQIHVHGVIARRKICEVQSHADVGIVLCRVRENVSYGSPYCCPNKLFEYTAAGLAILASNQPSIVSWVEGRHVGVCVDPTDPDAIAEGLQTLTDPDRLAEMRRNARKAHLEEWNLEAEAEKAWAVMRDALRPR